MARQEADVSSHAFGVWSGRMVTARAALTPGVVNRYRSRRGTGGCGAGVRTERAGNGNGFRPPLARRNGATGTFRGRPQRYLSMCSIPCLETFPRVTVDTSLSSIQSGLVSGALSRHAHAW